MSTRSNISKVNADGSITSIYCHSDGYLSNNGKLLLENYQDEAKVVDLIALGDISFLGKEVGSEKNDFDDPDYSITCAYGRDRGESDKEARTFKDLDKFAEYYKDSWCEYAYKFENGEWKYSRDGKNFKLLTKKEVEKD